MTTAPASILSDIARLLTRFAEGGRAPPWPDLLDFARARTGCDACTLLRRDGETLVPLAVLGLTPDALGRRYRTDDQPRLAAIMQREGELRFPADCALVDPFDGLIPDLEDRLRVHDCVGVRLRTDQGVWGALTLDALRAGAFDGLEGVIADVGRVATALVALAERHDRLAETLARAGDAYRALSEERRRPLEIAGGSPAVEAMLREIDAVADSPLAVLVQGETGVGKELVAQRLHRGSRRADAALIHVNCAALPDHLVESELFGHVRGAFSGAIADRRGRFELADRGTLFLDEIGELPLPAQSKLLRALQNGEIQRVGSDRHLVVDVRIVAATNRDLAVEVREGRFRADLYHRLSVYPLRVPPLRERGRDALLLAGQFLERERAQLRLRNIRLSPAAERALLTHSWPGNVRELQHVLSRAVIRALAAGMDAHGVLTLEPEHLDLSTGTAPVVEDTARLATAAPAVPDLPAGDPPLRDAVDAVQRALLRDRLARHGGNWAAAARSLGIDRSNLARLAKRLGIAADEAG